MHVFNAVADAILVSGAAASWMSVPWATPRHLLYGFSLLRAREPMDTHGLARACARRARWWLVTGQLVGRMAEGRIAAPVWIYSGDVYGPGEPDVRVCATLVR